MISAQQATIGTKVKFYYVGPKERGYREVSITSEPFMLKDELAVETDGKSVIGDPAFSGIIHLKYLALADEEAKKFDMVQEMRNNPLLKEEAINEASVAIEPEVLPATQDTTVAIVEAEVLPPVLYREILPSETEPVLITEETLTIAVKKHTAVTIDGVLDETGYKAAKKNLQLLVKTRTTIEKLEKEENKKIKDELAKVKDYTSKLYKIIRDAESNVQGKITAIDNAKAAALQAEADKVNKRREEREQAMYDNGMLANPTAFVGHGLTILKDWLMGLDDTAYAVLVSELQEANSLANDLPPMGTPVGSQPVSQPSAGGYFAGAPVNVPAADTSEPITGVYERTIPELGIRIVITKGEITPEPDQLVVNDCVNNSYYYLQVLR